MIMRTLTRFGLAALLTGLTSAAALAATDVVVMSDQAKLVSISGGEPATVVVGNPNIADVTVQDEQVFVHGRNFGTTNMIVLDREGKQLAAFDVTVMLGGSNNVSVYKSGRKFSYVCAQGCESQLQPGDYIDYFKPLSDEIAIKGGLATGASKEGE
jgi:hypothetical protein